MIKPSGALHAKPLSLCLGAALGWSGTIAGAATSVTSCADDGGPGTLRAVLAAAANGADIDVSSCSLITLTQGELPVAASVSIAHASGGLTTIDANGSGRVLHGTDYRASNGSLTLTRIAVRGGRVSAAGSAAEGGCIQAYSVTLIEGVVTDCIANSDSSASGGGIRGATVTLAGSRVENCAASAAGTGSFANGGGVSAQTLFECGNSTISGNRALATAHGQGGGVYVGNGSMDIYRCTVDSNSAQYSGGVLQFGAGPVNIVSSTISSNHASVADGGIFTAAPLGLAASTVAFNVAGVGCGGVRSTGNIALNSAIIANNTSPGTSCVDLYSFANVTGGKSLVSVVSSAVPMDTIVADPRLSPLSNHGGATRTHALLASSPAVDAGGPVLDGFLNPYLFDQRGFDRFVSAPDIGSYERQVGDDEIFYDGMQ